jgi:large subunit ribosomal protein L9
MKLILMEDIPRLGAQGDVVNVKDGFGRNYLIPSGKALPATPANLAKLTDRVRIEEARERKDKRAAEEMAERLGNVSVTIRVQADEHDKLYGAVHERDVAQALSEQGVEVDAQSVVLEEPLKMLGVYPVKLHLFRGVETEIKVWIIRE